MKKHPFLCIFFSVSAILGGCVPVEKEYRRHLIPSSPAIEGVSIMWMGTAGLYVSDGKTGFFIDPFVSRCPLWKVIFGSPLSPRMNTIDQWINRTGGANASAVLVSHSHYDHVLDAPWFAEKTGALLVGTESTARIGQGAGLPRDQVRIIQNGTKLTFGAFEIDCIESRHSRFLFNRVPYPGIIQTPVMPPAAASAYREGGTFAFHVRHPDGSFLFLGSAAYLPGLFYDVRADVVLITIAGRENTDELLEQAVLPVRPNQVIPIHFDDFFEPLDGPFSVLWGAGFKEFQHKIEQLEPPVRFGTIPIGERVALFD